MAYIHSNLGAFRRNRSQTSQDTHSKVFQSTIISWASLIFDAHSKGWLTEEQTQQGLQQSKQMILSIIHAKDGFEDLGISLADIDQIETAKSLFNNAWRAILKSNPDASQHLNSHTDISQ